RLLQSVRTVLKANTVSDIAEKAQGMQDEFRQLKRELDNANLTLAFSKITEAYERATELCGVRLVTCRFGDIPSDSLRTAADRLIDKNKETVCVFATVNEGKVLFVASCGKAAVAAGAHAGNILKAVSPIVGGGGGGRPDSATSGGKDAAKLDEALAAVGEILNKQIKK
ncbi:MAG: alanine--tRNA ligase, partial [Firmicutes bacterium HGW-Firmicutes-21]